MVVLYCHQGWRRMKEALIEGCINYLKFGYDFDGVDFPEMDEELFRKILEGDESADDIISSFITAHSLDVKYDASFDEIGRYPDSISGTGQSLRRLRYSSLLCAFSICSSIR